MTATRSAPKAIRQKAPVSETTGEKNLPGFPKSFGQPRNDGTRDDFRARVADALRKRLHPNTPLRKVDLAHALGITTATIDNWLARYSQPDGYVLCRLIAFFDAGFANEVVAPSRVVVAKLDDMRRFLAIREVNKTAPALAAIAALLEEVA